MNQEKNTMIKEKLSNKMQIHKCALCHDAPCKKNV